MASVQQAAARRSGAAVARLLASAESGASSRLGAEIVSSEDAQLAGLLEAGRTKKDSGSATGAVEEPPAGVTDEDQGPPDHVVKEILESMFKPKDVRTALGLQQNTMKPSEIVAELDKHIIGQKNAKRSVAIALRNRWRRLQLDEKIRSEVTPKNILMIGSTGVGKTEIGRRLAKLAQAPFVKVEATKYTEVGFHGRDVDKIVQDLVEVSITLTKQLRMEQEMKSVAALVENQILDILCHKSSAETRKSFRDLLRQGELDKHSITIDAPVSSSAGMPPGLGGPGGIIETGNTTIHVSQVFAQLGKVMGGGNRKEKKKVPISDARKILIEAEMEQRMESADLTKEAIFLAEQNGIVFVDEIDKIVSSADGHRSADASSEGVQRDLLPIIEGSVVHTKHGNVDTTNVLFIASGAFHTCSPSDLLPELQGRLPIRVTLEPLTEKDFYRILTEPQGNLVYQQRMLLRTEGLEVEFEHAAVSEIAKVAARMNSTVEDIGARRLHTIIEKLMEEVSFYAPDLASSFKNGTPLDPSIKERYLIETRKGVELPVLVVRKENVVQSVGSKLKDVSVAKFIL